MGVGYLCCNKSVKDEEQSEITQFQRTQETAVQDISPLRHLKEFSKEDSYTEAYRLGRAPVYVNVKMRDLIRANKCNNNS